MPRKTIILVSGKMGSGKTTLQTALSASLHAKYNGTRCHLVNFADPLYAMHNFCVGYIEARGMKRDIKKDGPLLQLLGTEWGRKTVDENIWVKLLRANVQALENTVGAGWLHNVFIIGDCRFKNELEAFPDALRIRLECNREARKARCSMWRENETHPSEVDLDDCVQQGKFDLIFNTATQSIEHCVTMTLAQIDKQRWMDKRMEATL